METAKLGILYGLMFFIIAREVIVVISEEINGTITIRMSLDEEDDVITHEILTNIGQEVDDLSLDTEPDIFMKVSLLKNPTSPRFKRNAPARDYARHGAACMQKQLDILVDEKEGQMRKGKSVHVALMVTENEEVQMTCHYCDSEDDSPIEKSMLDKDKKGNSRLWYKLAREHEGSKKVPLFQMKEVMLDMFDEQSRNRVFVTDTHTLVIKKVNMKDGGTYFCMDTTVEDPNVKKLMNATDIANMFEADETMRFLYHLDVLTLNDPRQVKMVTTDGDLKTDIPKAAKDVKINDFNIEVFTAWEEWSPCSSCSQPGTKRRLGVCTVKKIKPSKKSVPWYVNMMLEIYTRGLLCRSTIFKNQNKLQKLIYRPVDEMEEVVCKVSCKNFSMKVEDIIENDPGTVEIKVFVVREGQPVKLKCPKAPKDMPVAWINGTTVLIQPWLRSQTDGRVRIDDDSNFHISKLQQTDAGHYLCVMGGRILGRVMLGVDPVPLEVLTWRYAFYIICSYPFDFAIFLYLFWVKHKQRKKMLNYDILPPQEDGDSDTGSSASDINVN